MPAWVYREHRDPGLAPWVDLLWFYEGPTGHHRKRIFPNGRVELLVNMGEPYRLAEGRGSERLRTAWLSGLQHGPMVVEQPARQKVLGVRLRPAGAYAVLAAPMHEITGLVADLEDLLGPAARELVERCHEEATAEGCFVAAKRWISARVERRRASPPQVELESGRIACTAGGIPLGT